MRAPEYPTTASLPTSLRFHLGRLRFPLMADSEPTYDSSPR